MTKLGQQRLLAIVGRITQRPEVWDQNWTHCGSAHCVFGHAELDAGYAESARDSTLARIHTFTRGVEWLQLARDEEYWLYHPDRTLSELQHFAITGEKP